MTTVPGVLAFTAACIVATVLAVVAIATWMHEHGYDQPPTMRAHRRMVEGCARATRPRSVPPTSARSREW